MKYNKDLFNESEKLCLERNKYLLRRQESAVLSLIKEMLSDITKYYSTKQYSSKSSNSNNYCLTSVIDSNPTGNSKYYSLIASIIELGNEYYFKNAYAINIIPKYSDDNILRYRVEWDFETYYQKLQNKRKVKEKGKLN